MKDENGGWKITSVDEQQNEGNPVLKAGDSVLSVNDVPVTDPSISDLVRNSKGEILNIRLIRGGEEMTLQMKATMIKSANLRGIYFWRSYT